MKDEDLGLVNKAKAGEKKAFSELIKRYYEMVYAVSFGVINNREEAQDITQEIFIKLPDRLQRFEGRSKFKTWLYRVTVNSTIDFVRKRKPTVPLDHAQNFEHPGKGPVEAASQNERKKIVKEAMSALSAEHRAILVLREWHEMSYDEIAEILDLERGTVMSRLHYARKALADVLGVKIKEDDK